jgi:hypothetical protein
MKNLKNIAFLSIIAITYSSFALETPQTANVNAETLRLEKTIAELKARHAKGEKLLGNKAAQVKEKTKALYDSFKQKIGKLEDKVKGKLSEAQLQKIKQEAHDLKERIASELEKLKQ